MNQITDAKVRGFWADSKKMARFLSELLRQGIITATELGKEGLSVSLICFFFAEIFWWCGLIFVHLQYEYSIFDFP